MLMMIINKAASEETLCCRLGWDKRSVLRVSIKLELLSLQNYLAADVILRKKRKKRFLPFFRFDENTKV